MSDEGPKSSQPENAWMNQAGRRCDNCGNHVVRCMPTGFKCLVCGVTMDSDQEPPIVSPSRLRFMFYGRGREEIGLSVSNGALIFSAMSPKGDPDLSRELVLISDFIHFLESVGVQHEVTSLRWHDGDKVPDRILVPIHSAVPKGSC